MTMPAPQQPRGIWIQRILLAGVVVAFAATVFLVMRNSDAFLVAIALFALLGVGLAGLPAVLFLVYASRAPRPELLGAQRGWIYVSAVCLALCGVYLALQVQGPIAIAVGAALLLVGLTAGVRAARYAPGAFGGPALGGGSSSAVGILVVVIVALTLPKFACGCGEKTHQALLKSDLRNLVVAEQAFFADHHRFAAAPELASDGEFLPTFGDSVIVVATDTVGWHAVARDASQRQVCGIW